MSKFIVEKLVDETPAKRTVNSILTSTKYLDIQYKILIDASTKVSNDEEFEQLDALIHWLGEINYRLPEEGVVVLEMSG